MSTERDQQKRDEEAKFWSLAAEARKEVDAWPAWKQAVAAGPHGGPSPSGSKSSKTGIER
jgi:hypothetical protein